MEELLYAEDISKSIPGGGRLHRFHIRIDKGEIAGLLGPKGSGKTAATDILCGKRQADAGRLYWHETPVVFDSIARARSHGVYHVSGSSQLIDQFTVSENLYYTGGTWAAPMCRSRRLMHVMAADLLAQYSVPVDVRRRASTLNEYERFLIDLMKAVASRAALVLVSGAMERFSAEENAQLTARLYQMAENGISILLVSAHEEAVMRIANRVWLLGDGENRGLLYREDFDAYLQTGYRPAASKQQTARGPELLRLNQVCTDGLHTLGFSVHGGEVVGVVETDERARGLLLQLASGRQKPVYGSVCFLGDPRAHVRIGREVALIDGRRLYDDLFGQLTAMENFTLLLREKVMDRHKLVYRKRLMRFICAQYEAQTGISGAQWKLRMYRLSHAQQQAVSLYRWKAAGVRLVVLAYPFYETDRVSRDRMRAFIASLAAEGRAVLIVSQNPACLEDCCDRIHRLERWRESP